MEISLEHTCFNEDESDKPGLIADRSSESFISKIKKLDCLEICIKRNFRELIISTPNTRGRKASRKIYYNTFHASAKQQADKCW
jgi:hypothetical protein